MGLSRLSAMVIATNPVVAVASGPGDNGKFMGMICHGDDHAHHPGLAICSTPFVYETEVAAKEAMEGTITSVRDYMEKESPVVPEE